MRDKLLLNAEFNCFPISEFRLHFENQCKYKYANILPSLAGLSPKTGHQNKYKLD